MSEFSKKSKKKFPKKHFKIILNAIYIWLLEFQKEGSKRGVETVPKRVLKKCGSFVLLREFVAGVLKNFCGSFFLLREFWKIFVGVWKRVFFSIYKMIFLT